MFIFLVIAAGLLLLNLGGLMFIIWLLVEQFKNQREFDWLGLIATLCVGGAVLIGLGLLDAILLAAATLWGWK